MLAAVREALLEEPAVQQILGYEPRIVLAGTLGYEVQPLVEYFVVSDVEGESWNPLRVQWDIWALNYQDAIELERALRGVMHHDLPVAFAEELMWSQIVDSRLLPGPQGDRIFSRSLDQLLTPVRERYLSTGG